MDTITSAKNQVVTNVLQDVPLVVKPYNVSPVTIPESIHHQNVHVMMDNMKITENVQLAITNVLLVKLLMILVNHVMILLIDHLI
jgi:hypothetical protein